MLTLGIVLMAIGVVIAIGVLVFVMSRTGGIMLPSQRYHALIGMAIGGLLAFVGVAFAIYSLIVRFMN